MTAAARSADRRVGAVRDLFVHPVKSLPPVRVESVQVGPAGLAGDRALVVVDAATGEPLRGSQLRDLPLPAPTGDRDADAAAVAGALGRAVRLEPADEPQVMVAPVHLVSRQARQRAAAGDVPAGCSAADPRANLVLDLPDDDERDWTGRRLQVGGCVLEVTRTPRHCLGVYADVRSPGTVAAGDAVVLLGR